MKRLHVHVNVTDLERSVRFYTTLFGAEPTVRKGDYAKWMLEDPRVNLAISRQGRLPGIDHLGIQTESRAELDQVAARLDAAEYEALPQEATTCCYAKSDKAWSADPNGIKWESFFTFGESTTYGESAPREDGGAPCCAPADKLAAQAADAACCGPSARAAGSACCG